MRVCEANYYVQLHCIPCYIFDHMLPLYIIYFICIMSHAGIKHAAAPKLTKYILYCMYLTHTNLHRRCVVRMGVKIFTDRIHRS